MRAVREGRPVNTPDCRLLTGEVREVLADLPDGSADCCVTSPPYFGLRDYDDPRQIGRGGTLHDYVKDLTDVFAHVRRVLTPAGTLWLNLGDTYQSTGGTVGIGPNASVGSTRREGTKPRVRVRTGLPDKNLIGVPWRVAFALQDDGWILRSEITWVKTNPMPESVRDRPTRATEQVFVFSRSPRYFYDAEAAREPRSEGTGTRHGRNVWHMPVGKAPGLHYAVFPAELPQRCIRAGCPAGGRVLDPFSGSGTTGLAALSLGRAYTGIDLNPHYTEYAARRLEASRG